jgi:C4-dicarboxylate-binding protein DctP
MWMEWFKERVEKRVGDKVKIDLFPGSQLGDNTRMTEGVQLGTIEAYVAPTSFYASVDRRFQALDAPAIFDTIEHSQRAIADPEFKRLILGLGEAKNVKGLSIWVSGMSAMFVRNRALRTVEDFRGLKLRVLGSRMEMDTMQRLGATGIPMSLSETLPAIQTNVLDGSKTALVISDSFKYHTLGKYQTETDEALIVPFVSVNKPWFDKLPADVRQVILEESARLDNDMTAYSIELRKGYRENWVKNGGEMIRFSPAEQRKLLDLLAPIGAAYVADKPDVRSVYDKMVELAKKYKS